MEEVQQGFLQGPYHSEDLVSAAVGCEDWVVSRRFAVFQGAESKCRTIDDFKESGINSCFTVQSHLTPQDLDVVATMVRRVGECLCAGQVCFELTDGTILEGRVHPDWHNAEVLGRGVDLSKAYKQVPVHPSSLPFTVLAVEDPTTGAWNFFTTNSTPFGSSASVYSFNRISRSIWYLLVVKLGVMTTVYYDDFPMLESQPVCEATAKAVGALLDLLGWRHATTGPKATPFSTTFSVLGAEFDLANLGRGEFKISNKPGRVEKLISSLDRIRDQGTLDKHEAASLHGALNFATGFFLGKQLRHVARFMLQFSAMSTQEGVTDLCSYLASLLQQSKPRSVYCSPPEPPCLVFSDAAWENEQAGAGGLFYDPRTRECEVFQCTVPKSCISQWLGEVGSQIISQLELFTALMARCHYRDRLIGRRALFFVDNEAARFGLIKASSPSVTMLHLISLFHEEDLDSHSYWWVERVQSDANPADAPSRGIVADSLSRFGASQAIEISPSPQQLERLAPWQLPFARGPIRASGGGGECPKRRRLANMYA